MTTRFPLLVQLEYYVGSKEAADIAKWLYQKFNDDPAVPGIRIPIYFTPNDGSLEPPKPRIATEAERVVVVLLADDHLAAKARKTNRSGITWADYAVHLRQLCDASPEKYRFVPVQLMKNAYPIDKRLADLTFLQAWDMKPDESYKFVARRLTHLLIRILFQNQSPEKVMTDSQEFPPLNIFLSHAKLDVDNEPQVVKKLLEYLNAEQPEKPWYDRGDILVGSPFKDAIEQGISDAVLLAVLTDSYSSRSWCRREVLLAKQSQRPVIVVNAVQEREIRSFPYAGNTPVIRWKEHPEDVVDLLLLETLRHTYARESLNKQKQEGDEVFPGSPELVTMNNRKCKAVLYPDPPLGHEELKLLESAGIQIQTPLQRHVLANNLRDRLLIVALSISQAEDLAKYGLCISHLESAYLELSRYLLLAGIRLAYGGHLQDDGYTVRLADLLHEPIIEQLRGEPPKAKAIPAELFTYIAWPTPTNDKDIARLGSMVETRQCDRPVDIDETLDSTFVEHPLADIPVDNLLRRFAWSRGLTMMRSLQTSETNARIIIGGKLGQKDYPYKGVMPGILEEALLSIQAKHPIYVIGAFGGCARLIIDAIEGIPREELSWKFQSAIPYSDELRRLYKERKLVWHEYEEILAIIRQCGYKGLNNGLSIEENRELANTRSIERIVELIFLGLNRVTR